MLLAAATILAAPAFAQAPRPGAEWATRAVPVETFAQFPQIYTPRLSPDGRWIAVRIRAAGGQSLAILPLGGGAQPELVARDGAEAADKQGDRQVRSWRWLDNDHLLVAIVYHDNLLGQCIDIQRFAVYNRATKKVLPLAWESSIGSQSLLWASRDGQGAAGPRVLLQRFNPGSGAYGWAQALAEQGYVVIQPNYRGSTGYGRAWEKDAEGKWGGRMSDDLNDAIPFLAGQGLVDPKRVCMFGWSYGGYASARAAQRDGKLYRCTIAGAAPVDMAAMVAYDKDYLGRYRAKQALGSASTDLDSISPALHANEVSTPILIVHGAKDQRVPVAQARGFVARLKKAGKVEGRDFEYLEQPQNTHNLLREADRVQLLQRVQAFLAKRNPA